VDGLTAFWAQSDSVGRAVALLLLGMSVWAWVTILWKLRVLRRVEADLARAVPAFWAAEGLDPAVQRLQALDREGVLAPLVAAALAPVPARTVSSLSGRDAQLTRQLRDALHGSVVHLQSGQVLLASVGSTAPFVGLFGTVWGIYHALMGMAAEGAITLEKISGPVGEALIMTAAGIAVAVPAVLAYNAFGKAVARCEAELEGFAHDLRELALQDSAG